MRHALSIVVLFLCTQAVLAGDAVQSQPDQLRRRPVATTSRIPSYAKRAFEYIRQHHEAPPGYVGGRRFGNYQHKLPVYDRDGKRIDYQEWDLRPRIPHRNRGPERIVTGSDGRAWYTPDHYRTFIAFDESD